MRNTALLLIAVSVAFLIALPLFLIVSYNLGWNNIVNLLADIFHEVYFTIFPGFLILGVAFFFRDFVSKKEKKGGFHFTDGIWIAVSVAALGVFVWNQK